MAADTAYQAVAQRYAAQGHRLRADTAARMALGEPLPEHLPCELVDRINTDARSLL